MLSIIDRFLLREVFKTLLVIIFILMTVLLASQMVSLLGKIAAGALRSDLLFSLLALQMVWVLAKLLPAAFFFALLWVLANMYRDNEMTALFSSGVSLWRIYRSALISALPVTLMTAVLAMSLGPWAGSSIQYLKHQQQSIDDIGIIRPAKFNEFQQGNLVVYTESLSKDGQRLKGVFLQDRQEGKLGIVVADEAYLRKDPDSGEKFIVLVQGKRYQGIPGQEDYTIAQFTEYGRRIEQPEPVFARLGMGAKSMQVLLDDPSLAALAEVQYRLSLPLVVLALAILAVPLVRSKPRQDIYGRVTLAILIYFIFINLQRMAERWIEVGITPNWLGMWWVPLLIAAVGGLFILGDSAWWAGQMRQLKQMKS